MKSIINKLNKQRGSASLFVVIFAALLITTIVVSFVRIMVNDQQQATATDLAQSAYDSAQAGVEDSKRALLWYQTVCSTGTATECANAKAVISSSECNLAVKSLEGVVPSTDGAEIKVQTKVAGSDTLNQAYTCTKIEVDTSDFVGSISNSESKIIPLISNFPFNTVQVEWFNMKDLTSSTSTGVTFGPASMPLSNPWTTAGTNKPPIMRTQIVQSNKSAGFTLGEFDASTSTSNAKSNTLFLYPRDTGINSFSMSSDVRRSPDGPTAIRCSGAVSSGGFLCTARLTVSSSATYDSLLRLTTLYGKANFRIKLYNGASQVKFSGVQPSIDSTGRANDLYKRVQTRVEMDDSSFAYPEAAVDVTGNFCKNFFVTDVASESITSCTP